MLHSCERSNEKITRDLTRRSASPHPRSISCVNRSPGLASSYLDAFPLIQQWLNSVRSSASRLLG